MNYISQLNGFWESIQTDTVSAAAICLYSFLLHIDNRCGWKREFTVSNSFAQGLTGMSRKQIERARNELKTKGYIEYTPGTGNRAGTYLIVEFVAQMAHDASNKCPTNGAQMAHNTSTLNKQNETKPNETSITPITPLKPAPKPRGKKAKPDKVQYAEFVAMTEEEYGRLVEELGEADAQWCIQTLSNYKGASGKKYKSDYLAMRNWVINRMQEDKAKGRYRPVKTPEDDDLDGMFPSC